MKVTVEKAFPRGGRNPGIAAPSKGKFDLFRKPHARKRLKLKPKEKLKAQTTANLKIKAKVAKALKQISAEQLSYKTITEGMLILGCVKEIGEFGLKVNLPGRLFGEVPITNISDSYTKALEKLVSGNAVEQNYYQLDDMFNIGQFVVTRVTQIAQSADNEFRVTLTMLPQAVHSDWSHRHVQTGLVMPAAVSSAEDHGYVMDLGIKGVRAFLKKKSARKYEEIWNHGKPLGIGQIVRCLVTKSTSTDMHTTVELSANSEEVAQTETDCSKVTMQTLMPGMLFTATITHVIRAGVQVKFAKNQIGYVHEDHLNEPCCSLKDVDIGSTYPARVLYVLPTVKSVFMTLLNGVCDAQPPPSPFDIFKVGAVVSKAEVVRVVGRGVLLSLGGGLRGFVSVRHLADKLPRDPERPLGEQLQALWPVGSTQKCRVLGYDHMAQLFSCTLRKSMLAVPLFSPMDCTPGMLVSCLIENVKSFGLEVSVGDSGQHSLPGFVPAIHMADIPLSHPEKKFSEGAKYKARVLQVKNNGVWLTLKPSLVDSTRTPLTRYEEINKEAQYDGVIVLISSKGILVTFYDNIKGWVPTDRLSDDPVQDPMKLFYVGQVVKCYVAYADEDDQRLTLSLVPPVRDDKKTRGRKVREGESYAVVVTAVGADCLHVKVRGSSEEGVIPAMHLTDYIPLAKLMLATYKVNDVLSSVYCFGTYQELVFSVRPSVVQFFRSEVGRSILDEGIDAVDKETVIPCSVRVIHEKGILVNVPFPNLKRVAWVAPYDLYDGQLEDVTFLGLYRHQVLMARVRQVNLEEKILTLSTKLSECWDYTIEPAVALLRSYLNDHKRMVSHLREQNDPLAKLTPGNVVEGVVKTLTEIGAVIALSDGAQAVVMPHHYERMKLKAGVTVKGMVLLVDALNHCAEITLRKDIMARVNVKQDGILKGVGVGACLRGETMVAKPDRVLVSLKGAGRLQLASIPVRCHLNDFNPGTPLYILGKTTKIIIHAVEDGVIIGVPRIVLDTNIKKKIQSLVQKEKKPRVKTDKLDLNGKDMSQTKNCNDENGVSEVTTKKQKSRKSKLEDISGEQRLELSNLQTNQAGVCNIEVELDPNSKVKANTKKQKSKKGDISEELYTNSGYLQTDNGIINGFKDQQSANSQTEKKTKKQKLDKSKAKEGSEIEISHLNLKKRKLEDVKIADQNNLTKNNVQLPIPKVSKSVKEKKRQLKDDVRENPKKRKSNSSCEKAVVPREIAVKRKDTAELPRLSASVGFVWDAKPELLPAVARSKANAESSSDEDDNTDQVKKKKKKLTPAEKRELAREEEKRLREVERQLMDAERNPQSADDFDRLVLAAPNNSMCWIKYMAFHLQATEIEKARAVAERALKTISFREEQEKLNVWMALLNLENMYGTKESLDKTLQDAVQMNDSFKVYMQMLQIYADSSKIQEADRLVQLVTKKFRDKKETWLQAGDVYMKCKQLEKARALMQKALAALDKKDHVEVITRFALLENKYGEAERAQTLMEHILTSYPKRVDVWSSYVDMLVKSGHLDMARQVLERSVVQKLAARKMKALFKKFLQFEEQHGTPEGADRVRQMALEYVESATSTDEPEH